MNVHFIVLLCLLSLSQGDNVTEPNTVSAEDLGDAYYPYPGWSDTFDWKLLKAFSSPQYKNVLISPISLKLILALLYEGSSGSTEIEFQNVLHFPPEKQAVRENFRSILEALKASERREYVLNVGTRIFMDSNITPQQHFAAKALDHYHTDIEATNFTNPEDASRTINSWVDTLTNGRISQIVKASDLEDAIMVIGNAIYFKGTWLHPFLKNQTHTGGFYISPTDVINVEYMTRSANFYFHQSNELDAKILRLPYRGSRYAFYIVLPNSKAGLPELIKKINLENLRRQLYFMELVPVEITIPKIKFDFSTSYTEILQEFGLRQMFQNTASFPGIARGYKNLLRMLSVTSIVQKSGIELDEEGSVIYTATDVQLGNKFGVAENYFNVTHPFLFFIEEQSRGTILFVGKVENPLDMGSSELPSRLKETGPVLAPSTVAVPEKTTVAPAEAT